MREKQSRAKCVTFLVSSSAQAILKNDPFPSFPAAAPGNNRGLGAGNWDLQHLPRKALLSLQLHLEFGEMKGRNDGLHQQGAILTPSQGTRVFMENSQFLGLEG